MLELYPHNQDAYNEVKKTFEAKDRTCIVHATGTGKSLIAGKLIFDNPNSKFLFIAPTIFIFREIKKHIKGHKYNIQFRTYSSFLNKPLNSFSDYDYIILDEFHRIGAKQWGEAVKTILDQNNKAKVLGLSATHIRFLDDNRNIAEEIFDNNIASYLSLGEAIEKRIHKVPTYISALYNIKEILDETEIKLSKSKNSKEKERLKSNRIIWEKSNGVDFILKKYISINRKKILVFCKNVKHIDFIKSLIVEPLKEIYQNNIDFQTIYSAMGVKETLTIFNRFETQPNIQVLFCVDMLNEGIHVKNVDTILMFRDTISPIIYFQQMGRCFAVGQKQNPLIFDFVNNFNIKNSVLNIQQNFYQDFNKINQSEFYKSRDTILNFYDEILNFKSFINSFNVIKLDFNNDFIRFISEYILFRTENNREPTQKEFKIINLIKNKYNNNQLSEEQINSILNINPNFFDKHFKTLDDNISEYILFRTENNREPKKRELPWVAKMKARFNNGKLKQNEIDKILNINPDFFKKDQKTIYEHSILYKSFVEKNNRYPNQREFSWVKRYKDLYKRGKLDDNSVNILLEINPNFFDNLKFEMHYNERINLYHKFRTENNREPTQREMPWYFDQRRNYNKGKLSQDKIDLCLNINPDFFKEKQNPYNIFDSKIKEYILFRTENNREPTQNEMPWIFRKKIDFKKGRLKQNEIDIFLNINPSFFV